MRRSVVGIVLSCVLLAGCASSGTSTASNNTQVSSSSSGQSVSTSQSNVDTKPEPGAISDEWIESEPSVNAKDSDPEFAVSEIEKGSLFRVDATRAKKDADYSETFEVKLADGEGLSFDGFTKESRFMFKISKKGDPVYEGPIEGFYGLNEGSGEYTIEVKPLCSNGRMLIEKSNVDALCVETGNTDNFWLSEKK